MVKMLLNSLQAEHQEVKDKMDLISRVEFTKLYADILSERFRITKMNLDQAQNIFNEISDEIDVLEKQKEEDAYNGAYFKNNYTLELLKKLRG